MNFRWLRILGAAVVAELIPILALVAVVALFGPAEATEASAYAERTGRWLGPIVGALATFAMALWVARPLIAGHVRHGVLLGVSVALLDAGLLVASAAAFSWLFVFSGLGRVAAGWLGGRLAAHRYTPPSTA